MLGSKLLGIIGPLKESVQHRRMRTPSLNLTSHSQWWQLLLSYGEGDYQERESGKHISQKNETTWKWILWISRQRNFLTFLVLCSGPRKLSRSWWLPEPLQPRHRLLRMQPVLCHWMLRVSVQKRHGHDFSMERRHKRHNALASISSCRPYTLQHWNQVSRRDLACLL